ncbi:MAG: hypothetical protein MUP16_02825, partial [Sedimentisphaerales bacterium]|nr:hypothetical protein [Sedimentisphaerales bacterium]
MKKRNPKSSADVTVVLHRVLPVWVCLILLTGPLSLANAGWEQVPKILSRINAPQFPDKDFNITDYGAVGDGNTD